jgi:hypothetical protein
MPLGGWGNALVAVGGFEPDDRTVTDLITHLESFLGEIGGGTRGDDSTPSGLQVVWFGPNSPFTGVTTIMTLGLSQYHLNQPGDKGLHQELLMHLPTADQPGNAAGLLFQVAGELIARGRGLLRGEVVGPRGRLFDRGQMTALYAATPVYLPDNFAVCDTAAGKAVMAWLVPITGAEADYVRTHGWTAFEAALVAEDPDFTEPSRSPVTATALAGR